MNVIDLRSDTVSRPSLAMREIIKDSLVGDDVLGDDPTVKLLEAKAAKIVGKQAALFVPSGTMANLIALLTHCGRGDQAIVGSESHILHHEGLGAPALGGINLGIVHNQKNGRMDIDEINYHFDSQKSSSKLMCLENTQNRCGGTVIPQSEIAEIAEIAHTAGASVHIDGARIFNAAHALETDVASLVQDADTLSFCFSKGLGAPVGSVLTGTEEFINRARSTRRQVGGAMRQSGIIAAAALFALENNIERIGTDHINARRLAEGLAQIPGINVDLNLVQTNMIFISSEKIDVAALQNNLAKHGILVSSTVPNTLRLVTHLDIPEEAIDVVIDQVQKSMEIMIV
ncbi:MAG: low-specificity L-threonine aldolase [Dehalococcoidia bacterium]